MVRVNLVAATAGAPHYLALDRNTLGGQVLADAGNQAEKHEGKGDHPCRHSAVGGHE